MGFAITLLVLLVNCKKEITPASTQNVTNNIEIPFNKTNTGTYLPLTKNTHWTYDITSTTSSQVQSSLLTVLGLQKTINNKNYETIKIIKGRETDTVYYAKTNNQYYLYTNSGTQADQKIKLEILFLYDDQPVGYQWQKDAGYVNGMAARCIGKITEKNILFTVKGQAYKDVIHTTVQIQAQIFFGFYITVSTQDFHVAKDIGIVTNTTKVSFGDASSTTSKLTNYKIK